MILRIPLATRLQLRASELLPEKLRPKISSSGGSRSFGVVVVVILSFVGSISCILLPTEASA
jgi:hypothetical protein